MWYNLNLFADIKKGSLDTPSIAFSNRAQVAFSATPSTNGKGSRKRLNLFSPGSMRKNKKYELNIIIIGIGG